MDSETRQKIFREAQSRLPKEDRAADLDERMCLELHPSMGVCCTKKKDHGGEHVAHGALGEALRRWNQ